MNNDVVSAEEARGIIEKSADMPERFLPKRLARTVLTLHRELAVLRAQLPPLLAVHDALVAAAALPGAGASGEAMVAAVRRKGVADGMAIMHTVVGGVLRILATDDGVAMLLRALEEHREGRPVTLEFDLLAGDDAIAKARREGAPETTATSFGGIASDAEVSRG